MWPVRIEGDSWVAIIQMYIIAIAWTFVVVLMAAAEAMETSVLGGLLTFMLYCALPLGLFLYIFGTPQRRRNQTNADTEASAQHSDRTATKPRPDCDQTAAATDRDDQPG